MANNNIKIGTRDFDKYKTPWKEKIGVFETPRGNFIVRIRKGKFNKPTTISQHDTEKEAQTEFDRL